MQEQKQLVLMNVMCPHLMERMKESGEGIPVTNREFREVKNHLHAGNVEFLPSIVQSAKARHRATQTDESTIASLKVIQGEKAKLYDEIAQLKKQLQLQEDRMKREAIDQVDEARAAASQRYEFLKSQHLAQIENARTGYDVGMHELKNKLVHEKISAVKTVSQRLSAEFEEKVRLLQEEAKVLAANLENSTILQQEMTDQHRRYDTRIKDLTKQTKDLQADLFERDQQIAELEREMAVIDDKAEGRIAIAESRTRALEETVLYLQGKIDGKESGKHGSGDNPKPKGKKGGKKTGKVIVDD